MYATDVRQTSDVRQHNCLMPPPRGWGHNNPIRAEKEVEVCGMKQSAYCLETITQLRTPSRKFLATPLGLSRTVFDIKEENIC